MYRPVRRQRRLGSWLDAKTTLFSQAPVVHLERFSENRRDVASNVGLGTAQIDDLFERAQIAFDDHLGAGAMIFCPKDLRNDHFAGGPSQLESTTKRSSGRPKDFRSLLAEVNDKELREEIFRAVDASPSLRNKRDLIEDFVDSVSASGEINQGVAGVRARPPGCRARRDRCVGKPAPGGGPPVHRCSLPRRRDPGHRHRDHAGSCRLSPASRRMAGTAERSSASWPGSAPSSTGTSD